CWCVPLCSPLCPYTTLFRSCLMRYSVDGTVIFAGAHEEIVICRAQGGRCERVPTPGTWLGAVPDVDRFTADRALRLRPGDVMALDRKSTRLNSSHEWISYAV